jgi:hypothetical protein
MLLQPIPDEKTAPETTAVKSLLLSCPWFRVYDIIEDTFSQFGLVPIFETNS